MLCENCGKNEASVKYTECINGVKRRVFLCEKCSEELGIRNMDFNMPINLSSFLGEFLEDNEDALPGFTSNKTLTCNECGMTYDEFIEKGKFGCANCYDTFSNKIDDILKKIQGSDTHIGRKTKATKTVLNKEETIQNNNEDRSQVDILKEDLKKAIAEERYEDAANIRDEIKKLEK